MDFSCTLQSSYLPTPEAIWATKISRHRSKDPLPSRFSCQPPSLLDRTKPIFLSREEPSNFCLIQQLFLAAARRAGIFIPVPKSEVNPCQQKFRWAVEWEALKQSIGRVVYLVCSASLIRSIALIATPHFCSRARCHFLAWGGLPSRRSRLFWGGLESRSL